MLALASTKPPKPGGAAGGDAVPCTQAKLALPFGVAPYWAQRTSVVPLRNQSAVVMKGRIGDHVMPPQIGMKCRGGAVGNARGPKSGF